jgi:hypothetical protein
MRFRASRRGEGFENKIADLVGAAARGTTRNTLRDGLSEVVIIQADTGDVVDTIQTADGAWGIAVAEPRRVARQ